MILAQHNQKKSRARLDLNTHPATHTTSSEKDKIVMIPIMAPNENGRGGNAQAPNDNGRGGNAPRDPPLRAGALGFLGQ